MQEADLCRLCLQKKPEMSSIFLDETLPHRIMTVAPYVKIARDDGLPHNICKGCVWLVNSSFRFRIQCEVVQIALQKYVKDENMEHLFREVDEVMQAQDIRYLMHQSSGAAMQEVCKKEAATNTDDVQQDSGTGVSKKEAATNTDIMMQQVIDIVNEYSEEVTTNMDETVPEVIDLVSDSEQEVEGEPLKRKSCLKRPAVRSEAGPCKTVRFSELVGCDICRNAKSYMSLFEFLHSHGNAEISCVNCDRRLDVFPCERCGKQFKHQTDLDKHKLNDHYVCQFCRRDFSNSVKLLQHIRLHYPYNKHHSDDSEDD